MIPVYKLSESTVNKLKELGVNTLYLFGSFAEGTETPFSDYDIGIIFNKNTSFSTATLLELYNKLYDILLAEFADIEREIDIVFLQKASLSLNFEVISRGIIIFEDSAEFSVNYEERVMRDYLDFQYFLKEYEEVTMETFSK
jgi:predicted nucleotidyltransferase